MTISELKAWQKSMGYTNQQAADELGMSRSGYQQLLAGASRTTKKPLAIDRRTALACTAIAASLPIWTPPAEIPQSA